MCVKSCQSEPSQHRSISRMPTGTFLSIPVQEIPGVLLESTEFSIHDLAIRPEPGTQGVHEALSSHPSGTQVQGCESTRLSGRLVDVGKFSRGMRSVHGYGFGHSRKRGFLINLTKSRLTPSQVFDWLGVRWDTIRGFLSLPQDKILSWKEDLRSFVRKAIITRRRLKRVPGKLQFAALVDSTGKTLLKSVNRFFKSHASRGKRDCPRIFLDSLRKALRRWLRPGIQSSSIPYRHPPPTWHIFTDASLTGWGAQTSLVFLTQWQMVPVPGRVPHQHRGVSSSIPSLAETAHSEGGSHLCPLQQLHNCCVSQSKRVGEVSYPHLLDSLHSSSSAEE